MKLKNKKVKEYLQRNHQSHRRRKILELVSKGLTQAQIARKIGWSYSTVKREIYALRKDCRIKEKNLEHFARSGAVECE